MIERRHKLHAEQNLETVVKMVELDLCAATNILTLLLDKHVWALTMETHARGMQHQRVLRRQMDYPISQYVIHHTKFNQAPTSKFGKLMTVFLCLIL